MLMLDCRVDKVTTPPDMVRVLRQRALDTTDKWVAGGRLVAAAAHNAASFAVPPGNYFKVNTVLQHLATDSNELFGTTTVGEAPSLTDIIRSYTKLLTRLPKEGPVPVIVIGAQPASALPATPLLPAAALGSALPCSFQVMQCVIPCCLP